MLRFWKELKYSMGLRKHILFILMVIMGLISAVYLFRESLENTLKKSFPSDYGVESKKENTFHIEGSYEGISTAKEVDIQAEMTINQSLRHVSWMTYEEAFLDDLYVRKYNGPDEAVIGFGTDKFEANKKVSIEKSEYAKVQSAWVSEDVLLKLNSDSDFGAAADRLFASSDSNYLDTIDVVLGAGMNNGKYKVDDVIDILVQKIPVKARIIGFLNPNATITIGGKVVNLNYYFLCPLLDIAQMYAGDFEGEPEVTNSDSVYIPGSSIYGDNKDEEARKATIEQGGSKYQAAKCLWISEEDLAEFDETAPEWLRNLKDRKPTKENSFITVAGANYEKKGEWVRGQNTKATSLYRKDLFDLVCIAFIPEGETLTLHGQKYNLDDYLVISLRQVEKKEDPASTNTSDSGKDGKDTKDGEGESGELTPANRMLLFRMLVKKNSCSFTTKYTADEAQRSIAAIIDEAWENYKKDNPKLERTSSYVVKEADEPNSVIYRDKIREIPKKLVKIDSIGYIVCIILLLAYLLHKMYKGSDYYTMLILTGDTKFELMLLFVFEAAVLYAFSCGLAFVLSWAVCKLLGLGTVAIAPILSKNLRIVVIPFAVSLVLIAIRDFAKGFRR